MKKSGGVLTVEAALVLPVFILVTLFIINFLNIFYLQLTIQQGLNNAAGTLSEYCYAIDLALGMDQLVLDENTKAKGDKISGDVNHLMDSAQGTLEIFHQGLSISRLSELLDNAEQFANSAESLHTNLQSVDGDDVVNFVLSAAVNAGGDSLVDYMVDDYLTEMKVNRNLIDGDIKYHLRIVKGGDGRYDLTLAAVYQYKHPMFSVIWDRSVNMCQTVVVHPWIGGKTKGLRQK